LGSVQGLHLEPINAARKTIQAICGEMP
jgi:hypothetical protein